MYMRNCLSIILLNCLFFFSCIEEERFVPPKFPFVSQVETINISDDILISYAYGMCVDEKYIYILALVEDTWLQVYDKTDGRYIGGFIRNGQGPGELIMGYRMGWDNEKEILSVYDQNLNKLLKYSVNSNDIIPEFSLVEEINFNNYSGIVREAWETKSGYIVDGQLGKHSVNLKRYQMLQSGIVVDEYNTFPVSRPETFLQSRTTFSPLRDKMAVGVLFGATLETFDLSNQKIECTSVHQFYPPKLRITDHKITPEHDMIYGFASLTASDDKIYSVWVENHNPNAANSLAVFDWKGNPLAKYETEKLLFMISASIDEPEKVYALAYNNEIGFSLIYIQL